MSAAPRVTRAGEHGFILLEMIVTVSVLAILVSLVTAFIGFGLRLTNAGRDQDDRTRILRASATLDGWFASAMPVQNRDGERRVALFDGGPNAVRFVSLWTGRGQAEGTTAVSLQYFRAADGSGALQFSQSLLAAAADALPDAPARDVLLHRVRGARFSYYGSRDGREPPAWFESWQASPALPRLASLKLDIQVGSHVETVEMTYRINAR